MFHNRNQSSRRSSGKPGTRRPQSGGSRFGGGRSHHSSSSNRSNKRRGKSFDISQFVKKAIKVTETEVFNPKHQFSDFEIHEKLKQNIADRGFISPMPIQDGAIPHILKGRDIIGIANTGTGKTAAFLIPLINKVFHDKTEKALIMVPTRELATQIAEELRDFSAGSGLRYAVCIGGSSFSKQLRDLSQSPSFVISTPGRLRDLVNRKALNLSSFNNVVLDEADRMLDMGFINDIRDILAMLSEKRQSLFFSATMPKDVAELSTKFLSNPVTVEIQSRPTSENVEQNAIPVRDSSQKMGVLHDLLLKPDFAKVLIFRRTKRGTENLSKDLIKAGFRVDCIHGDKSQRARELALRKFAQDDIKILVATDVAARGLDIPDVSHVINYELPESYEDYIHRIGRTGRGKKTGNAITFFDAQ